MSESFRQRGGWWVVVQFVLMISGILLAPVWRGNWGNFFSTSLAGLCLAVAAVSGILGKRELRESRTAFPKPKADARLVTTGIYAVIRHPLYVSVVFIGLAWSLAWASRAGLLITLVIAIFLDCKARFEERMLRAKFPGYDAYAHRVRRFVPGVY